jgi:hypothetical protein
LRLFPDGACSALMEDIPVEPCGDASPTNCFRPMTSFQQTLIAQMNPLSAPDTGKQLQIGCAGIVGKRVQVRAVKTLGSARFLHGLQGTVIATHAIALNWVIILLDPNTRTPHLQWSIPFDRLVACEEGEPFPPSAID